MVTGVGSRSEVRALLFDLGGVLIDVDFKRAFAHWQPVSRLAPVELQAAFGFDMHYERHERGEISAAEYFAHLRSTLRLDADDARIAEGWNAIFAGEITETRWLLQAARGRFPCYAFSNSNATHQRAWSATCPEVVRSFERIFVSSDIGLRKPERAAFEHVAAALELPAGSILFFDDLAENVAAAKAAGMPAVHVRGPGDVRDALVSLGCAV